MIVAARPSTHHPAGRRMHHVHPEIRSDFLDHFRRDCARLSRIALNERVLAQSVDQARDPVRAAVYLEDGVVRKKHSRIRASRQLQAAVNVTFGLVDIQRRQMGTQGNALLELPQIHRIQLLVEFGLPHQKNLQQLLLRRFQIGQQPDLLQHFHRKMVSFVDHQHRGQALLVTRNYERTQVQQKVALSLARGGQAKITSHVLQEIDRREPRVEDICIGHVAAAQQLQQAAHQQGLARAYFPGHYHEAFAPPHSVVKRCQRLVVSLRREKKRRVWSNLERVALQIVETLIHWESTSYPRKKLIADPANMVTNTTAAVAHPSQTFRVALCSSARFTMAGISAITSAGNSFLSSFSSYMRSSINSNAPTTAVPSASPMPSPIPQNLRRLGKSGL